MKAIFTLCVLFIACSMFAQSGNNWMTNLPNSTKLSDLSIPGTHDSGASSDYIRFYNPAQPFANAQNTTIEEQLSYGVRYFDIRVGEMGSWWNRSFSIVHGAIGYRITLPEVIGKMKAFLNANPGEVIIMSLKIDNASGDKYERIRNHCRDALVNNQYYTGRTGSKRLINDINGTTPSIHQLGWARGQIIIMDRGGFGPNKNRIGINASGWANNTTNDLVGNYVRVQDRYSNPTTSEKLNYISNMRNIARNNHGTSSERLTVNFASCTQQSSLGVPVAISTVAGRINPSVKSHYNNTSNRERCILAVDYVDRSLAEAIWRNNFNGSTFVKSGNATNISKDKTTPIASIEEQEEVLAPALTTTIAPNPASGPFSLMIDNVQREGNAQIIIYDMQGRTVLYKELYLEAGMNNLRIEEAVFARGLYLVNIATEHGEQQTVKLSYQ
jgi:1-phosphatidylinositol phosphodiesterase